MRVNFSVETDSKGRPKHDKELFPEYLVRFQRLSVITKPAALSLDSEKE